VRHGVGRDEAVAVLTECSPDLPATVLGIWKAGAAYLPLARELPAERLAFMVRDAGVRVLIVLDGAMVPDALVQSVATTVRPETLAAEGPAGRPSIPGTPQDLAYIIYTSGTTGLPKGVALQHDGLVNAILATGETIGLSHADRIALFAMPGFDASVQELGLGLLYGQGRRMKRAGGI
jgi:non-ribosomal peptide synthetase component F